MERKVNKDREGLEEEEELHKEKKQTIDECNTKEMYSEKEEERKIGRKKKQSKKNNRK